jgi:hypothetical protein
VCALGRFADIDTLRRVAIAAEASGCHRCGDRPAPGSGQSAQRL